MGKKLLCVRQHAWFLLSFMSCVHFLVVLQFPYLHASHIFSFLSPTSSFSNVRSPFLQLNYYFSNCHVNQGKLHGSVDRLKTALSQVYSDYNVTLISSHMVHVRRQKHAVHLFLLLAGLLLTATFFHICPFSAAVRLHLFICQMLLFKVPDKWGIKLNHWWLTALHNYILNGSLVILESEPTPFHSISQIIINCSMLLLYCMYMSAIAWMASLTNAHTDDFKVMYYMFTKKKMKPKRFLNLFLWCSSRQRNSTNNDVI